jgi:type II secretory pathway pseudopilin PulG
MQKNSGFLIIEVLIAIIVLSTTLLSVFAMIRTSQIKTQKSDFGSEMVILAQNSIEIAVDNLKNNWISFPVGTYYPAFDSAHNTWELIPTNGTETNIETRYTRKIEIKSVCRDLKGNLFQNTPCPGKIDENSKFVSVDIGWVKPDFGKPFSTKLLVIKTD